jgi:hypothetical protein
VKRVALVIVAACGGQILDEPNDAALVDVSKKIDAATDAVQIVDVVVVPDVSLGDATSSVPCKIATTNLVAYWPLDTDTKDASGHGNDATGSNLASVAGVQDGAMHFDGVTSKLRVTSGTAMLAGARTLCAWVRPNNTIGAGQPVFWGGYTNMGDFYSLFSNAPGNTSCSVTNPTVPFIDHWGTDCYEPILMPTMTMKWNFVCYAFDVGAVEASVDGNEGKAQGTLYDYPLSTLYIGSTLGNGTTTHAVFDGDIDEVSVWSMRLQQGDLAALWNGGAGCKL